MWYQKSLRSPGRTPPGQPCRDPLTIRPALDRKFRCAESALAGWVRHSVAARMQITVMHDEIQNPRGQPLLLAKPSGGPPVQDDVEHRLERALLGHPISTPEPETVW